MSYHYVSAVTRTHREDIDWVSTDLSQVKINDIFDKYYQACLTLSNPVDDAVSYLTSEALRSVAPLQMPAPTVAEWLASLDNQTLPTVSTMPLLALSPVGYSDIWQAGYGVNLASRFRNPNTQATASSLDDLLVTKPGLDMVSMSQYLLTTVNGYMHRSEGSVDGLYIVDGGKSHRVSGNNHAGVLSFLTVGTVKQIAITPDMLYNPHDSTRYAQSVYVNLGESLAGKTVLMSIGGYLHVLDGTYVKTGDSTIKINMYKLPFPERLYQSRGQLDLSGLPIEEGEGKTGQYVVNSIYSDAVVRAYLTMSQTFAIVIDAPLFYVRKHQLERFVVPGRYFHHAANRFPLFGSMGRLWDYRLSKEEDVYVYGTEPIHETHYQFQTAPYLDQLSINGSRVPARPWSNGAAFLLEMGAYA